jgi:choline dehydrogenase-like flavoprotein
MQGIEQGRNVERDLELQADAVVIGTGAGGAAAAAELAEGGLDVVMLEEGPYVTTAELVPDVTESVRNLYRAAGAQLFLGRPNVTFAEGRCVGGSTLINGALCWRTPEKVLKRWQWEERLPELSYSELEPVFEKVEERINVAPQAPESIGRDVELLKLGADRLGYETTAVRRNHKHCVGTNLCGFGCPTGAKQSTLLTYVPRALAAGARLYSDCTVLRVWTAGGRAAGVEAAVSRPGSRRAHARVRVRAPVVVLACGATQSPALLQRSRIRSESGLTGKSLFLHPNIKVIGLFDESLEAWKGSIQGWQVTQFMDEGIMISTSMMPPALISMGFPLMGEEHLRLMSDYPNMLAAGALVEDSDSSGRVRSMPFGDVQMTYRLGPRDAQMLKRGAALTAEILFAAGARGALPNVHGLPALRSMDELDRLFDPRIRPEDLEVLTVHAMSSCRMGGDPRRSVVGPWGEHHQVRGLFVADASVFPGPIGVNPQVTIMALATRTGQHILAEQKRYVQAVTV